MYALRPFSFAGLVLALALLPGCQKEPEKPAAQQAPQTPAGENRPLLNVDAGQAAAMHVNRAKVIQALKGDMNQLAQFYIQYATENGRGPANWQDFKAYMGNDGARYAKLVESGQVAVVYNASPASNVVIAYEKKEDLNKIHVVVFGDKHVQSLSSQDLQKALQNRQ
jgi:hypothetical protein